ncbi:MAG: sulfite exporter TauE/SafE family protein [Thermodesulfovibrionales bacterium]|nr:sulfite exporter TauE/SafE family protein [Thermodesulfovibrionales bacterium]
MKGNNVFINIFIGICAGFFGGLVGLGGGVVMIPMMVGILKLSQHQAHGTSLVALVFTGATGAITYYLHGNVDVIAAILLAITSVVTVRYGAKFAHSLPEWKLKRAFGGFLIFASAMLMLKPYIATGLFSMEGITRIVTLLITGLFAGFIAGMMGVGGGTVMVPPMVILMGMTQHMAQGTSLMCMVAAGIVGAHTHWKLGNVVPKILFGLIVGIILGTYGGSTLAQFLPELYLRIIFSAFLTWTGIKYLRAKPK